MKLRIGMDTETGRTVKLGDGPEGGIRLPLADDLMLAGRTREQAAKDMDAALSTYQTSQVTMTSYAANKALGSSAIERPGAATLDRTPKLPDVLSGTGPETGPNKVSRIAERRAIDRGHDEAALAVSLSPTITVAALFGVGLP